ncbi:MAG: carboxypeptidase regulatory-like domain-containing protein [Bryobacterales bacterium]|nr:carboxypeptidase regulatory-like domain-containing protein [Bryobacterales bacterium]
MDFLSANEAELEGVADPIVLAVAVAQGRVSVTHDRQTMPQHFGEFLAKGQTSQNTLTDSSGQYTMEKAGDGRVYVSIVGNGYLRPQPRSVPVNLRAGETVRLDFELTPAPGIRGAIVDADTGEPLRGCRVTALRKIVSEGEVHYARTYHAVDVDENGAFRLEWLEPGDYAIEVNTTGGLTFSGRRIELAHEKRCLAIQI